MSCNAGGCSLTIGTNPSIPVKGFHKAVYTNDLGQSFNYSVTNQAPGNIYTYCVSPVQIDSYGSGDTYFINTFLS